MNHLPDNERLLKDVLAEESAAGFREALLVGTLRQVRGRRWRRRAQRIGGAMVLGLAVVWLIRPSPSPVAPGPAVVVCTSYELVCSQPLPAAMMVTTRPFAAESLVVSSAAANVLRTTTTSGGYREIGDDELLAMSPEPAALVRRGPHQAELVFVTATDEERAEEN